MAVILAASAGCTKERDTPPPGSGGVSSGGGSVEVKAGKISLLDPSGQTLLKLKPKGPDYKIYDGADKVLGKIKVKTGAEANKVTLKSPDGTILWKVKPKDYGASIKDGSDQKIYKVKRGDEGKWKLKNAAGETLFKLKPKDYGFKVRDAGGATVAKVKVKGGKLSFKSESGDRLYTLKGTADARAGMWFALDKLSLPERATLCVFFLTIYR
jgi:hypothetical protein